MRFTVRKFVEVPFEAETIAKALRLSAEWVEANPNQEIIRIIADTEENTVFIFTPLEQGSGQEHDGTEIALKFK